MASVARPEPRRRDRLPSCAWGPPGSGRTVTATERLVHVASKPCRHSIDGGSAVFVETRNGTAEGCGKPHLSFTESKVDSRRRISGRRGSGDTGFFFYDTAGYLLRISRND